MMLLGALAALGVIVALFISARKRNVEVVSLQPPELDGPAVPQRLAASKQAVRAAPPPLPVARENLDAAIQSALRAGNKIEAIKRYREKTGLGLKEAKDAIDAMAAGAPPPRAAPPSPAAGNLDAAIDAALRADQLIQAIKLYREKTGLGLAEAKRAVEARRDQLRR